MGKLQTNTPVLIMLYGYPGAGKTHFAHELSKAMEIAHVQGDRIRSELFEKPQYTKQEDEIVTHLMEYMTEEFMSAGVSVVFDTNATRLVQRRALRDIARKAKAKSLIVWLQTDQESAMARIAGRDRRRNDDRFARPYTKESFKLVIGSMQKPQNEDYVVISGKHTFAMQRNAIVKKLYDLGVISTNTAATSVAKPGLVNLVPTAGRVDPSRRNVIIR